MFSLKVLSRHPDAVVLGLWGSLQASVLSEIDHYIKDGRKNRQQVVLDLSEVTLIDRAAAHFLEERLKRGIELVNCPLYITHWITPEHK